MIENGQIIIFPTDTVYGLGAKVKDSAGQERIMALKHRLPTKRFAVLCASLEQIKSLGEVTEEAEKIIKAFMPGGLTIILKCHLAERNYALGETVAVRIPNHPLALQILQENGPMATTSVNISSETPINDYPTIVKQFADLVDCIYDDSSKVTYSNVASTIVNLTNGLEIIREGQIKKEDILKILA